MDAARTQDKWVEVNCIYEYTEAKYSTPFKVHKNEIFICKSNKICTGFFMFKLQNADKKIRDLKKMEKHIGSTKGKIQKRKDVNSPANWHKYDINMILIKYPQAFL